MPLVRFHPICKTLESYSKNHEKDKEKLQSEFEKNKQRQLEKQILKEERLSSIEERKVDYSKGDRVRLLDTDEIGLVYEEADKNDNVTVYLSNEYKKILRKSKRQ